MPVRYETKDHIAVITLDRAEARNAINTEMHNGLMDSWIKFRDDKDVRVAVITGAGDQSFCAGLDLKELVQIKPVEEGKPAPGFAGITRNLDIWKPIIAAINGHCLAGGLEIALACDIRIAASHATFGLTEVKWGIIPGAGGTQRLPRVIPRSKALELMLTAEKIDAEEALRLGLISKVVEYKDLMPAAMELAGKIAENAPLALTAVKRSVVQGTEMPLDEGLELESKLSGKLWMTRDSVEGRKAFAEKRKPNWKGK